LQPLQTSTTQERRIVILNEERYPHAGGIALLCGLLQRFWEEKFLVALE